MNPHPSLALLLLLAAAFSTKAATELHVSPSGRDTAPGTAEQPFATLQKAREAARGKIAAGLEGDLLVTIRGGTYRLGKPLVFGPQDGGTNKHAVTWSAAPGEQVIISGGRPVGNWRHGKEGLWITDLPEVKAGKWFFRQLYANGERLPRGRFPEKGFLRIAAVSKDSKTLQCVPPLPDADLGGSDAELLVVQNWSISRERIVANTSNALTARTPIGWIGHGQCIPRKGLALFLEHAPEFVRHPGQWHLDRKRGRLIYMANKDEDPNKHSFIAPALDQLLLVEGTAGNPVRNLEFRGLELAHTSFAMPGIGYNGIQACYHGTSEADAVTHAVPVAVDLVNAHGCRITNCRLNHLGGSGIGLGAGCRDNLVSGCVINDVGGTGVNLGHMPVKNPLWADWKNPADAPTNNEVSNCHIHHCGAELWGAHGIFDAMTKGTRIRHNEIAHLPYGGITTGYVWGTQPTSQENCLIEFNHVHDVMLKLNDSGCIYTLGFQPGSIIRGNLLHGVRTSGFGGGQACNNGIFFDEGSKGFHLEDNVIYDVDQAGGSKNTAIRFNRSQQGWQTWKNNTIQVEAKPPAAARILASKAGLEPQFRKVLMPRR